MLFFLILMSIVGILVLPYWIISSDPFLTPSGQTQVGVSEFIWDSPDRSGILAKAWYPTDSQNGIYSPYLDKIGGNFSANLVINLLLKLIFSHAFLGHIKTPALADVIPIPRQNGFPVILFSSGFGSINSLYTFYALEFASHGFIVIGINHPSLSVSTMLTNGSQIGIEKEILDGLNQPDLLVSQITLRQAEDISIVVDKILSLNSEPNSIFHQKIDVGKIFAAGHSIGGSASFAVCGTDPRISKSVNLDGYFYMNEIDMSCTQNEYFLILSNRVTIGKSKSTHDLMVEKDELRIQQLSNHKNFTHILFQSATHWSFIDLPLIINPKIRKLFGLFGQADPLSLLQQTSVKMINFFNSET